MSASAVPSPPRPEGSSATVPRPGRPAADQGGSGGRRFKLPPLKLRHVLFLLLLVPTTIPLMVSAYHLIGENRDILKTQQKELLTHFAQSFAQLVSDDLARHRQELRQLGEGLVAAPGDSVQERLRKGWAVDYLRRFAATHRELLALQVVDRDGVGQGADPSALGEAANQAISEAFERARDSREPVYSFTVVPPGRAPAVAIAVPVSLPDDSDLTIVQAVVRLPLYSASLDVNELFLVDADGDLLWTAGQNPQIEQALLESELVRDFAATPLSVTSESEFRIGDEIYPILARVVPVEETGWGVVAHKASDVAFQQVEDMVKGTALSLILAVILAFAFALLATGWFTRPIQRLAEASHEIAAGHFDRRVPATGLAVEVVDLAADFNRMSDYVENYIERLRRAAEANRKLFISTIRAFAAAIDAKDPYTRGHSERVARYSRAIARYLGLPKDVQEKIWIAAVLHDIGKIGVEDQVLRKMGRLTNDEFDQMKLHTVIGADIVEPVSALRNMIPGIRWHHEAWNGSGYPDGLKGEEIPLMARVIGVADTFDAITTNRPYQEASTPEFALDTIRKLTGKKFDAKIVTAFFLAWEAGHIQMDPRPGESSPGRAPGPPAHEVAAR